MSIGVEAESSSLLRAEVTTCCFLSLTPSLVPRACGEDGELGVHEGDGRGEEVSVILFTLLLLLELLPFMGSMSMGRDEGELEREGIAGVLLERNMAGLVVGMVEGGVEERICTVSLSSSYAGCSWSQSILCLFSMFFSWSKLLRSGGIYKGDGRGRRRRRRG